MIYNKKRGLKVFKIDEVSEIYAEVKLNFYNKRDIISPTFSKKKPETQPIK